MFGWVSQKDNGQNEVVAQAAAKVEPEIRAGFVVGRKPKIVVDGPKCSFTIRSV